MKRLIEKTQKAYVAEAAEFLVNSNDLLDELPRFVEQHCRVVVEPGSDYTMHYLDTFDWRLYGAGWTLYATRNKSGGELVLATRRGEIVRRIVGAAAPAFARDLPPGRLRETVGDTIEPRRLLARARMKIREKLVRVVNADEKTVVRLVLQRRTLCTPGEQSTALNLAAIARVSPVKGYTQEHKRLLALLENELRLSNVPEGTFASAMRAAGLTPGGHQSKSTIALQPQMRGDEAVRTIYQSLLDTIVANVDGVRRNIDPEFLHEYRVAIRATRSALKQIRGVFPQSKVRHFSNEFKWLGTATGPVRDLDVYLLKMEEFRAELPSDMREQLQPLEKYLHAHHDEEQQRLVRTLESERYRALMDDWSDFLSNPLPIEDTTCPGAARPVIDLASDRIWRSYRHVWKRAKGIEEQPPADALHALRIECKKLRYLLEFFNSLYPPAEMRALLQPVKRLQTTLGNLNDCEVQRLTLRRIADEMYLHSLASADTLLAMGRLMNHLLDEQLGELRRFRARFGSFAAPDIRKRYRRLFRRPAKVVH